MNERMKFNRREKETQKKKWNRKKVCSGLHNRNCNSNEM